MRIKQLARKGKLSYRYKMFKAGKFMMTSALASVALWGGLALTNQTASAATTQTDNAVTETAADTSATTSTVSGDNVDQVNAGDVTATNNSNASVADTTVQSVNDATTDNDNNTTISDTTVQTTDADETITESDDAQEINADSTAVQPSVVKDDTVVTNNVQSDDSTVSTSESEGTQAVDSAAIVTTDTTAKVATDSVATPSDVEQATTLPKNVTFDETTATAKVVGEISDADLTSLKHVLAAKAQALSVTPKIEMLSDETSEIGKIALQILLVIDDGTDSTRPITVPVKNFAFTGASGSTISLKDAAQLAGFTSDNYTLRNLAKFDPVTGASPRVPNATWNSLLTYESTAGATSLYLSALITDDGEVTATRTINYQVASGSTLLGNDLPDSITESLRYTVRTNHATGVTVYEPVAGADTYLDHNTPEIEGYTADETSVTGRIAMIVDELPTDEVITVTYTGNTVTSNVDVPTTVIGAEQPAKSTSLTDVTGNIGQTLTLTMPTREGYTPDKTTVSATVNLDGTITTKDTVTYTPNEFTSDVIIPATVNG